MNRNKKAVVSWWFYDWANSAFILTVVAGFFPVFFKTFWCDGVDPTVSTARLGLGNAVAGFAAAALSPLLGAVADLGNAKKRMLLVFLAFGATSTLVLFFMPRGEWIGALSAFLIASVGFNCANIFYDALLVDVTERERMDWVSSVGYGVGYLGCGLLFLVNVLMVNRPALFGLSGQAEAIRVSFLIAALWWIAFSVPLFLFVRERGVRSPGGMLSGLLGKALKRISATAGLIAGKPGLLLFLIAYWLYIDGVHTFVFMAVDFGMAIGLRAASLMIALLVVQFVGFPSSLLFGALAKRFGAVRMIIAGICIYILVCGAGTLLLRTGLHYIVLAALTGVAQGGIQALSRSYFGKAVPPDASAEYFGFFNIVNRFAVIIGPAMVGGVVLLVRNTGAAPATASRIGMSSVSLLFIAGAVLLAIAERLRGREGA